MPSHFLKPHDLFLLSVLLLLLSAITTHGYLMATYCWSNHYLDTMTSSNGNTFRVTDPLCGEFIGHRWIPLTKASDAELWYFLWSAPQINGWVNNREAGDLRPHLAHCDVIVMNADNLIHQWPPVHPTLKEVDWEVVAEYLVSVIVCYE